MVTHLVIYNTRIRENTNTHTNTHSLVSLSLAPPSIYLCFYVYVCVCVRVRACAFSKCILYFRYINYGSMGSVIGHEMMHAFDGTGMYLPVLYHYFASSHTHTHTHTHKLSPEYIIAQLCRFYINTLSLHSCIYRAWLKRKFCKKSIVYSVHD